MWKPGKQRYSHSLYKFNIIRRSAGKYWARVYSDQMEGGYNYYKLRKTISINILDFDYLEEEKFHNTYKVFNEKSKKELSSRRN